MVAGHDSDLLTIAEAARLIRVSPVTVQRWLRQGRLRAFHVGPKAVRIRRDDLAQVVTPLSAEQASAISSPQMTHGAALALLDDAGVAQQQAALAASAELLAQQAVRRGGEPFDESWPLIRAARAMRSRQQS